MASPDGNASPANDGSTVIGPDSAEFCERAPSFCNRPPPDPCDVDGDGVQGPQCGGDDCDDHDDAVYPGYPQDYPCDNLDQDCDGSDYCPPALYCRMLGIDNCVSICEANDDAFDFCPTDGDGDGSYACAEGVHPPDCDCDDGDATIKPGATEIECDGIDQDCSGFDLCHTPDTDGDGYSACAPGSTGTCDCNDDDMATYPYAPEVPCDGIDQDCDGVDCCDQDDDMDGFACKDDCDDNNQAAHPGACFEGWSPLCFDVNCDGRIDKADFCDAEFRKCGGGG